MLEDSSLQTDVSQAPVDMESDDICWICLDGTKDRDPLINPCRCPRKVHPRCLARWQLQQAGRLEETNCRFCQSNLADWKASLTPENLKPDVQRVQPIMVVYFEGQIHRIPVKQGPEGLKEFTHRIRELFRLPDDVDISLTFGCKEPLSGQHLKLEGIGAFDAAVHCASVAAAERQQKLKSGGGSAATASSAGNGGVEAPSTAVGGNIGNAVGSPIASAAGNATGLRPGAADSDYLNHRHNHQNYHNQVERSASAAGAIGAVPSSVPVSTQTSSGGADATTTAGTGTGGLHAAASAPVLTHYASDSNLLATAAASATHTLESSVQGCVSLPEEPASTRSSSGGGVANSTDAAPSCPPTEQQQQRQRQPQGSASAAVAAAMAPCSHPVLSQRPSSDVTLATPFQLASSGVVDFGSRLTGGMGGSPQALENVDQHQHTLPLISHFITPPIDGPSMADSPLAGCLSEPYVSDDSPRAAGPNPASYPAGTPFACATPPPCLQGPSSPPSTPPPQQQLQQPAELACLGFPYSIPVISPYAAPMLPPLLTPTSSGGSTGPSLRRGSDGPLEHRPASPSLSPSPSLAAAAPLAPRDHYVACTDADGRSDANSSMPYKSHTYSHRQQRQQSMGSGRLSSKQLQQQHRTAVLGSSELTADNKSRSSSSSATNSNTCSTNTTITNAGNNAGTAVGPATPNHPVIRRTVSPTSLSRLPIPTLAPSSGPSLSSTGPSGRHHPYLNAAPDVDDVKAPSTVTAGGGGATTRSCNDGNRHTRRITDLHTDYDLPPPLSCATADDSAALGSLTGRLKFSLRAFSRKVARSLNFQKGGTGHGAACGAVLVAPGMMPSVVGSASVAAAVSEAGVLLPQADAEAEVEEITEIDPAAAASVSAIGAGSGHQL
ncbi:hypothetical protein VaNZ11_008281 [Volvox africanus]|uniref:RING-CH-type domain-containing protein n=1 Tax=Volvox africanus TaxID=51714 RepID=A0ABQ5S4Q7_9CHLO|nr:hypothetical protein VaNZ11_008281 [Volvox africanus]